MKDGTVIKKYKIADYSKMSDEELSHKMDLFGEKFRISTKEKMTSKMVETAFLILLNLYNITEEMFRRHPHLRGRIDFEGEIADLLEKNSINATKN